MYGGVVVGGGSDGGDGSGVVVVGYVEMIYLVVARFWRYIFFCKIKKKKERKIKLIIIMA